MTRHPLLTTRQLLKFLACRPTSRRWQRKMSLKWTTQPCQSELIWIKQSCPSFCKDSRSWWKKGENVRLSHALLHLSIIKNDARWWSNILPCPTRPDNPVEYLAQYLIKNNPQTTNWIESRQHSINHIPCPCYTIALMNLCNINVITYPVHVLDEWCTDGEWCGWLCGNGVRVDVWMVFLKKINIDRYILISNISNHHLINESLTSKYINTITHGKYCEVHLIIK